MKRVVLLSLWRGKLAVRRYDGRSRTEIIADVCAKHRLTPAELVGHDRRRSFVLARHEAMAVMHAAGQWSLSQIAQYVGGRHHSTVIYAVRAHEARIHQNNKVGDDRDYRSASPPFCSVDSAA